MWYYYCSSLHSHWLKHFMLFQLKVQSPLLDSLISLNRAKHRQGSFVINLSWSELPQNDILKFISFHIDSNGCLIFPILTFSWIDTFAHAVWMTLAYYTVTSNIIEGKVSEQELAEHTGENIYRPMTSISRTEVWQAICEKISCKAAYTNSWGTLNT